MKFITEKSIAGNTICSAFIVGIKISSPIGIAQWATITTFRRKMPRTFEDILASSRDILKSTSFKKTEKAPEWLEQNIEERARLTWYSTYFQVLAPVGFEWSDEIFNLYHPDICLPMGKYAPMGREHQTIIVHGHSRLSFCSASSQCHILGYTPVGNEGENFAKRWERFGYGQTTK